MTRKHKDADEQARGEKMRLHNEALAVWDEERANKLKENNDQPN